ncbi:MAG: hypothetical protein Q9166_005950 [cf. Caloplaca sp. 2 TL-2023]
MDDLSGLSWTSSGPKKTDQKPLSTNQKPLYPALRPTPPVSGRSSPFTAPRSNASTPANDSFANLVSFSAVNGDKNLSLQEQQKRLQEKRARPQQGRAGFQSGQQDEEFWEKLASGTSTPNPITSPPEYAATAENGGHMASKTFNKAYAGIDTRAKRPTRPSANNDLLSSFDTGNHDSDFERPKIVLEDNTRGSEVKNKQSESSASDNLDPSLADDDDPFGLGPMTRTTRRPDSAINETSNAEDDILGLLGRPVSEFPPSEERTSPATPKAEKPSVSLEDQALAELVDMGFTVDKSRQALATTGFGDDVQSAVGWLLNQAHQESTSRSPANGGQAERSQSRPSRPIPTRRRGSAADGPQPAWMRGPSEGVTHQQRQSSRSPVNGDKDPSRIAAELGNNLFKTANSIWKTGTKKLNQAVADFNSDSDSSQPKWMREPHVERTKPTNQTQDPQDEVLTGHEASIRHRQPAANPAPEVTDEALMLESNDARPIPRKISRPRPEADLDISRPQPSSSTIQTHRHGLPQPKNLQQPRGPEGGRGRLSKLAVEEQTVKAYISPARRKKPTIKPPAPEPDLFGASEPPSNAPVPPADATPSPQPANRQPTKPPSLPQPQAPQRHIPPTSPSALRSSHTSRQAGTAAFKRGDYAEATTHYSSAVAPLPPTHPLSIPLLTNRALSHLKTGDPKNCIADSNTALDLIGPTRGIGEIVNLGDEGNKDMFTYWCKAMTRQAEALEQLERWADAGAVWKSCVEVGVGGATSIAGRNRCEKVIKGPSQNSATPRPPATKKPALKTKAKPNSSALDDLSGNPSSTSAADDSAEAVTRLRAANLEAERLDDEKFALSDKVSERVARWRSGKEGNLRALLASLDTVLWEGSGWKKVGMGELILAGKVKVVYMRGIGKVHPDKLPTTAATEQRMVSAAVFATLNEAWDGFKRENGL